MKIHALARRYSALVNRIESPAVIINPDTQEELATNGIWDTGATNSVITKKAVQKLKLPIREFTDVRGVGGLITDVPVYLVDIRLNNENIVVRARVTECEELSIDGQIDMLIGMNIILMIISYYKNRILAFYIFKDFWFYNKVFNSI